MTETVDGLPNADNEAAIRAFREELLAENWPDAETVARQLGSRVDTGAAFGTQCERGSEANLPPFRVWAGRDRGGYRYPPFQFLQDGSLNPKAFELLRALARQPDLHPSHDKGGWERAFWLYVPRGRLSVRALALHRAKPEELRTIPYHFSDLPDAARTPAEVFPTDSQAVIDLASDEANELSPYAGIG